MSSPVANSPGRLDPAATARFIRRRLRQLWWRRLLGSLLERVSVALLFAATALLLVGLYRFLSGEEPVTREVAFHFLNLAFLGTAIWTLGSLPFLDDVIPWIDHRAGTHDRFHTALKFAERPSPTPLELLSLAECVEYVKNFPVSRWTPIRLPRALLAVVVPLVSLGLLMWHASLGIGQTLRDAALQQAVAKRADALEKVAERLRQDEKRVPQPDLAKLAEAMKRSAERLKESQRQGDEQKLKTALGELSSLQAMLNAMKQAQKESKVSPGELAALAAALESNPQGKDAAEAIKAGQLAEAGEQLAKLAEQMRAGSNSEQALQQLAQSMQQQAAKLSEAERNEVAKQMQQAAQGQQNGQESLSKEAMQRLAELLRKAGKNGKSQAGNGNGRNAKPLTAQQLQELLNALENMKEGLQPGNGSPGNNPGGQQSLAMVESFGKNRGEGSGGQKPSGMPGGEHDQGVNEHLFADKPSDFTTQGDAKRLQGALGDGATMQELVGANSGPAKASRQYRDLYEAIAPAEQSSVEQENIPLGSRTLVRRYFENIRPQN